MRSISRAAALSLLASLLAAAPMAAQNPVRLELLPESRVWVEGTSNRENWTVNATSVEGFVVLQNPTRDGLSVQTGRFSVPAAAMAGGRGPIMDRLMHGALKSGEHPDIVYELVHAEAAAAAGTFDLTTHGRLTLAGVTREIEGPAQAQAVTGGTVRFTGSYALLMSDYGITPPTAMFGALRTGDRVVIHFDLLVRP